MDIKTGELVAIILVVCWVAKLVGLNSKYVPLLALVLGGIGAHFLIGGDLLTALFGVFTGLATTLGYREVSSAVQ